MKIFLFIFQYSKTELNSGKVSPQSLIAAVLCSIQDEKDPRNLVVSFDLVNFMVAQYKGQPVLG